MSMVELYLITCGCQVLLIAGSDVGITGQYDVISTTCCRCDLHWPITDFTTAPFPVYNRLSPTEAIPRRQTDVVPRALSAAPAGTRGLRGGRDLVLPVDGLCRQSR